MIGTVQLNCTLISFYLPETIYTTIYIYSTKFFEITGSADPAG